MHIQVVNCSKHVFLSCNLFMNYNRLIRILKCQCYAGLHPQKHPNIGIYMVTLLSKILLQILWSSLPISLALTKLWLIQPRKTSHFRFSHWKHYHVSFYPLSHVFFLISFSILCHPSFLLLPSNPVRQWPQVPATANASCPQINVSMET